jgi:uncharacterized protein YyaL (SSP411 family)
MLNPLRLLALLFTTSLPLDCMSAQDHVRQPLPSAEVIAKLPKDGGDEFNRLIFEQSPYLLQHARNPVDWYGWGEEAFAKAKAEDKPIFLSVGYSTCHWCHVMEKESFEDQEVADLMNANFICVKVDREERPDLDTIYMSITQSMTGRGGWPMTVVMTPERVPFFTGTYFPKGQRGGRPGMMQLVPQLGQAWRERREDVEKYAEQIQASVMKLGEGNPGGKLDEKTLRLAFDQLSGRFEPKRGGFGQAPKFPVPHNLLFLLQYHQRTGNKRALEMVTQTLNQMRRGGIYDHVGHGFHRYSTDNEWLVPHFEKMLYDQALMVMAYTAAFQVTGQGSYKRTAREVCNYVLRDLTAPGGGFYSAEDADSEGEEGLFYLWSSEQTQAVLGKDMARIFDTVYNIKPAGNFTDEATGQKSKLNIPHLTRSFKELADELVLSTGLLQNHLKLTRRQLFESRKKRIHPFKDDKILTDWNGLMISAFARAGQALDEERFIQAAVNAADFALAELRDEEGRLFKRYRAGKAGLPGTLEDYAFLIVGLLDTYEASFDTRYLEAAIQLADTMIVHFKDPDAGGFFLSADDSTDLLVRAKEAYDGAIPSGQSLAAQGLLRLARMTGRTDFEEEALGALDSHSRTIEKNAAAHCMMLAALDISVGPSFEIVIAGDPEAEDTQAMLDAFRKLHIPQAVILLRPPGEAPAITKLAPFTAAQLPIDGKATAYVCRNFTCKQPTTDIDVALGYLNPANW